MFMRGRVDVNGNVIVDDDADEDTDEMTTDMDTHGVRGRKIENYIKRRKRKRATKLDIGRNAIDSDPWTGVSLVRA